MWEIIREYLRYHKKERRAIITLCILVLLFSLIRFLLPYLEKEPQLSPEQIAFYKSELSKLKIEPINHYSTNKLLELKESETKSNITLAPRFSFNPNTCSVDDLLKIGFEIRVINNIVRYRNKGGYFKNKEAFSKLYGLSAKDFNKIKDSVIIEERPSYARDTLKLEKKVYTIKIIDINAADTFALMKIHGIGPSFARRILEYRERLGGFYKAEQLMEVWGIDTAHYLKIKEQVMVFESHKKININLCSISELRKHPYLSYNIANSIIVYRGKHGSYDKVDDIKQSVLVTDEVFEKIKPYLTVESND